MTAVPAPYPDTAPAWWIHWLNLAISAVSFVAVAVHPGWHPPPVLAEIVAPLALVLAVGSGLVFAVLHHHTGTSRQAAALAYLHRQEGELPTVAADVAPLLQADPAVEARLAALEANPAAPALPAGVLKILRALESTQTDPTPAPAPPAAPAAPGAA